jgi:hypothetical protein
MTRRTTIAALVTAALAITVAAGASIAPAGTASNGHSSGKGLVGTWLATVNLPPPAPPLRSMSSYSRGGTGIESSNERPGTRSPMFSTWKHLGGRLYAATGMHFIFDPATGAFQGTRKINRTLEVARDGQSLKSVARVTTFDADGNVVATFVARSTAQRMQLEPIPDLP